MLLARFAGRKSHLIAQVEGNSADAGLPYITDRHAGEYRFSLVHPRLVDIHPVGENLECRSGFRV
jgi:hypothetical protein